MATASKLAPVRINLPKNRGELDSMLGELGRDVRELSELDTLVASEVAKIKNRFAVRRDELKKTIGKRAEKITSFTDTYRHELLEGDSKSVTLEAGELAFYFGPSAVACTDDGAVIEECRKQGLLDAIRVVTTLNREWIDEHKDEVDIKGVKYVQTEFLRITPAGHEDGLKRTVREVEVE